MTTLSSTSKKSKTNRSAGLVVLMRPKHWIKNAFVIAPLIFANLFFDIDSVMKVLIATFLFCAASSATYVMNDLTDIEKDRKHPKKSKTRPLASGQISPSSAKILMLLLYLIALTSFAISLELGLIISAYLILNFLYSAYLKHQPVVDIFCIAIGFVLRVYAGASAIQVLVSIWMFITVLCLALFLAAIKRKQEILSSGDASRAVLNKYSVDLVTRFAEMSSTCTLVFYSLYIVNIRPEMSFTIPVVLFGLFRYWYAVETDGNGESPTQLLYTDRVLQITIVAWLSACIYSLI